MLEGGLSGDEARRRGKNHQHRVDDVDLRRFVRARLCGEQGRHRAVHQIDRLRVGARQHPGERGAAGLDRYRPHPARARRGARP